MTREEYDRYIVAFNDNDVERYTAFYAEDVLLELGARQVRGRAGIEEFYRDVKSKIRESLILRQFIGDEHGVAAELATRFEALADWPEFIVRPVKKGDVIQVVSFVLYRIEAGKFTHIRSARFGALH